MYVYSECLLTFGGFLPAQCILARPLQSSRVCLVGCLSHAGIVSKWLNLS